MKIDRRNNSPYPLYANEVEIYSRLRPGRIVNVPAFLGGAYDPESGSLGLLLEDLRVRSVKFPNVLVPVTLDDLRAVIDQVARLHAAFWCSPRLTSDLSWMQSHVTGDIHSLYTDPDKRPAIIAYQLETTQFKREMVQRLRTSGPELARLTAVVQRHQSTLPQTVVHGDAHIGNTFLIPDGGAGLVDWQLCVRGFGMHDVTYLLATSLPVADRRAHERELIAYYADRLGELLDAIDSTGYGLTLGIHSRIETTQRRIADRLRIGNTYVNRNQIGAVVGVQPFGGRSLSGTGPKAGGPITLFRFAEERVVSINTAAAGGNAALLASDEG